MSGHRHYWDRSLTVDNDRREALVAEMGGGVYRVEIETGECSGCHRERVLGDTGECRRCWADSHGEHVDLEREAA